MANVLHHAVARNAQELKPWALHVLFCEVGTDTPLPTSPRWGEESGSLPQRGRVGVGARGANFVKQYIYRLHAL